MISMKNFSQVLGLTIAQKLHSLKLQMTCFLLQTKTVRVGGRDESEDSIAGGKGLYLIQK